jgi:hypothetical protein
MGSLFSTFPENSFARSSVISGDGIAPSSAQEVAKGKKRGIRKGGIPNRHRKNHRSRRRRLTLMPLADGPGVRVFQPHRAWGTELTITRLQELGAAYHYRFPVDEPVWVHDISTRFGGKLKPHLSHRTGRDVDVRIPLKRRTRGLETAKSWTIDLERAWFIVKTLIDSCDVEVIFLDRKIQRAIYRYSAKIGIPLLQRQSIIKGFMYHWKGHEDHFHIRFRRTDLPSPVAKCYCNSLKKSFTMINKKSDFVSMPPNVLINESLKSCLDPDSSQAIALPSSAKRFKVTLASSRDEMSTIERQN